VKLVISNSHEIPSARIWPVPHAWAFSYPMVTRLTGQVHSLLLAADSEWRGLGRAVHVRDRVLDSVPRRCRKTAHVMRIIANNRAGEWRKLKA
jgi:hypothetical protein